MGVGTGIVGASVLAGELALAHGNHEIAYAAYEKRMQKYAGLWLRNRLFATKLFKRMLLGSTKSLATDQDLPVYP